MIFVDVVVLEPSSSSCGGRNVTADYHVIKTATAAELFIERLVARLAVAVTHCSCIFSCELDLSRACSPELYRTCWIGTTIVYIADFCALKGKKTVLCSSIDIDTVDNSLDRNLFVQLHYRRL